MYLWCHRFVFVEECWAIGTKYSDDRIQMCEMVVECHSIQCPHWSQTVMLQCCNFLGVVCSRNTRVEDDLKIYQQKYYLYT